MIPAEHSDASVGAANPFGSADVLAILRERGWLAGEPTAEHIAWCERAAAMLGERAVEIPLRLSHSPRTLTGVPPYGIALTR